MSLFNAQTVQKYRESVGDALTYFNNRVWMYI